MGFDSPTKATRCDAKDNAIDVGEIDRIKADETSMIDVGDVEATVDVASSGCGYAAVGGAKFGLLMAREGVAGGREERKTPGAPRSV
jgi:hypothetical protein